MAAKNPWKFATLVLAVLLAVSFFVPRDLLRPWESSADAEGAGALVGVPDPASDTIDPASDTIPDAAPALADTSTDPQIPLAIINDPACRLCNTLQFEENLKTFFPTLDIKNIDVSSAAGKNLVERFEIKTIPSFLFDAAIEKAANFNQVGEGLEKKEGVYRIRPELANVGKLIFSPNILSTDAAQGSTGAPVVIFEFSDFQCPFCKSFFDSTYPSLKKDYIDTGKVRFIFRHMPLEFHEFAVGAALASACAQEQGKFWEYHDLLFKNQDALDTDSLKKHAAALSLDMKKFDDCYNSLRYGQKIAADTLYAASIGISGTPSFIINGFILSGAQPYEVFRAIIDTELGIARTAP